MTTKTLDPAVSGLARDVLNHAAERDEWDLQPGLALVTQTDPPQPVRFPIPDELWRDAHPVEVMDFMAASISGGTASVLSNRPFDLAGILFVGEVWGMQMTEQERASLGEWLKTNEMKDHPSGQAKECRVIHGIDRNHTIGMIKHVRGDTPNSEFSYGSTGRIPDALERFMTAMEGAWKL